MKKIESFLRRGWLLSFSLISWKDNFSERAGRYEVVMYKFDRLTAIKAE
jgi:hypothetical protein